MSSWRLSLVVMSPENQFGGYSLAS